MHLNCLIALLTLATAASTASTTPATSNKAIKSKSNGSLYGFISTANNKYETAQFNRLLKSDPGYQPIIDLLNNSGAMTAYIPNDKAVQFFLDRQAPDLQKGQYPPPTAIINNVTMLDIVKQHITTGRYATTSNNYPAMVKSSILTNETIDHLGFGSPVLIDTNSTYTNFSDKNWRVQNARTVQWNVGNGWLSADIVQRDVPTSNGYLNVIDDVLQPPSSLRDTIDHNSEISQINNYINTHDQVGSYIDGLNSATIFLPNNDALDGIDLSTMSDDDGKAFLQKYVVNGVYYTSNWTSMVNKGDSNGVANLGTADGSQLPVTYNSGIFIVNNTANVTTPNILYNGGVVHIINQVLEPPQAPSDQNATTTDQGETAATKDVPDTEESPAAESAPATEETPATDATDATDATPATDEASATDDTAATTPDATPATDDASATEESTDSGDQASAADNAGN